MHDNFVPIFNFVFDPVINYLTCTSFIQGSVLDQYCLMNDVLRKVFDDKLLLVVKIREFQEKLCSSNTDEGTLTTVTKQLNAFSIQKVISLNVIYFIIKTNCK